MKLEEKYQKIVKEKLKELARLSAFSEGFSEEELYERFNKVFYTTLETVDQEEDQLETIKRMLLTMARYMYGKMMLRLIKPKTEPFSMN